MLGHLVPDYETMECLFYKKWEGSLSVQINWISYFQQLFESCGIIFYCVSGGQKRKCSEKRGMIHYVSFGEMWILANSLF